MTRSLPACLRLPGQLAPFAWVSTDFSVIELQLWLADNQGEINSPVSSVHLSRMPKMATQEVSNSFRCSKKQVDKIKSRDHRRLYLPKIVGGSFEEKALNSKCRAQAEGK